MLSSYLSTWILKTTFFVLCIKSIMICQQFTFENIDDLSLTILLPFVVQKSFASSQPNLLGWKHLSFLAYFYEPMSSFYDWSLLFFKYSFCIIFSLSLLFSRSVPLKKHKNDLLGLYEHNRKEALTNYNFNFTTQNKIHRNNKMHL